MIYVDEELCTGCGICVATCNRGALSLRGNAAFIDESLCTSCGRCLESCLTEAIISMEVDPQTLPAALAQCPETQPVWAQAPFLPSNDAAIEPIAPQPPAVSKLDLIEKLLNGLFAIGTYALDRKRSKSTLLTAVTDRSGNATASTGSGAGGCPGED